MMGGLVNRYGEAGTGRGDAGEDHIVSVAPSERAVQPSREGAPDGGRYLVGMHVEIKPPHGENDEQPADHHRGQMPETGALCQGGLNGDCARRYALS